MKLHNSRDLDFITLFNALWYRDFPITPTRLDINRRALWTTHIASTVKQSADLLGLFTCFETGGKTDAVIEDARGRKWAKVEWEWSQPYREGVNEIDKLASSVDEADTFIFIGYSRNDFAEENINKLLSTWDGIGKPLIAFIVTFTLEASQRKFATLETHVFQNGKHWKHRVQRALPWEAEGTKWAVAAEQGTV